MSHLDSSTREVDPELTQCVRAGRYAVPAERVAEAMLRRRHTMAQRANVPNELAEVERQLAVLVAGKRHLHAVGPTQRNAASGPHSA